MGARVPQIRSGCLAARGSIWPQLPTRVTGRCFKIRKSPKRVSPQEEGWSSGDIRKRHWPKRSPKWVMPDLHPDSGVHLGQGWRTHLPTLTPEGRNLVGKQVGGPLGAVPGGVSCGTEPEASLPASTWVQTHVDLIVWGMWKILLSLA